MDERTDWRMDEGRGTKPTWPQRSQPITERSQSERQRGEKKKKKKKKKKVDEEENEME